MSTGSEFAVVGNVVRLPVFENVCRTSSIHLRRGAFSLGAGESGNIISPSTRYRPLFINYNILAAHS